MKLIQVSDLHFVPPGTGLLGLVPARGYEAAIVDANRHHGGAELCLELRRPSSRSDRQG